MLYNSHGVSKTIICKIVYILGIITYWCCLFFIGLTPKKGVLYVPIAIPVILLFYHLCAYNPKLNFRLQLIYLADQDIKVLNLSFCEAPKYDSKVTSQEFDKSIGFGMDTTSVVFVSPNVF